MHKCEFCNAMFQARPQVKRPRACQQCQKKRQRENEKSWHIKNKSDFDSRYHKTRKIQRTAKLQKIARSIFELIETGKKFLHRNIRLDRFDEFLFLFLKDLGIRHVNKLWIDS